jgi:hypothetical protein
MTSQSLSDETVVELAQLVGIPLSDGAAAARIAAGASAAIAAVRDVSTDTLFDVEPSDYLAVLEQLADAPLP